ncbi:MAG: CocE/NonD family hydrolase [Bacteroidetes bacterium]|nr:CocE/NonD family hydrolase [Bacteroidota bacterium]MBS1758232.1 CocE/NonD family hydrolase [Bacteroidota bacterium]
MKYLITGLVFFLTLQTNAQEQKDFVKNNFTKTDTLIKMRDGIQLYTVIYTPKDATQKYPILMERTPYSAGPYGRNNYPWRIGPNPTLMHEKYIFVYQDVRGRYMSEGVNLEMTPYKENKKNKTDVDESSDTYDTIDWLLKNIKNNNGRVGIYGISYPGFYASASLPGAHPAIKAVSPQAPVTDEFIGDDANHNGAFFLMDNFVFMNYFGKPRTGPVKTYSSEIFNANPKNLYDFFLKLGPLSATQSAAYFDHKSYIWDEYLLHDSYDAYWQARNIRPHLKNITIPTLVVGGWFDAEDLFGSLHTYSSIEKQSPNNNNRLVMGPWTHGAWESSEWKEYASYDFGSNTSKFFQDSLETRFFNFYLKDKGSFDAAEATMFETGTNVWKSYPAWPPANMKYENYYLSSNQQLTTESKNENDFDEYLSDPAKPVPYTNGVYSRRNNDYMAEDQRFAATRPDVLVYETAELTNNVTLTGKITADLQVSLSGTDADFVVKLIDVLPETEPNFKNAPHGFQMAGYQRLVRAEVMRGKFRNNYENPEPFVPGKITEVTFDLNDVSHTFLKGHKIMVQVQSSWFPLVDINPQKFMKIPEATKTDYQKENIRIYHSSKIILPVLVQ